MLSLIAAPSGGMNMLLLNLLRYTLYTCWEKLKMKATWCIKLKLNESLFSQFVIHHSVNGKMSFSANKFWTAIVFLFNTLSNFHSHIDANSAVFAFEENILQCRDKMCNSLIDAQWQSTNIKL